MGYNEAAFLIFAALALAGGAAAGGRVAPWIPPRLLLAAVALRIVGATARYEILWRFYDGIGDAVGYYWSGLRISGYLLGNPFLLLSPWFWLDGGRWWGTPFLKNLSGIVMTFIGPSMRGGFLAFSLIAFLGLYAMAKAFHNVQPRAEARHFAAWIWLWPSLWFWPSSLGKEAILVLGLGLAVLGYARREPKINWPTYLAGAGLVFCIRPHVALVLAVATAAAHWLGGWEKVSLRRILEAMVALVLIVIALNGMRAQFGLEDEGFEGVREYVEWRAAETLRGGSQIGNVPLGPQGIPLAFVNVWMRPFLWEAHNATAAFAALEIAVFWLLAWRRRSEVWFALRHWRRHRLLRFALPFLLLYTLMIGIAFGNLGIIARQRAPIFPFMLMILATAPSEVVARRQAPASRRAPRVGSLTPAQRAR